jgi:hypothetical protein
MLRARRRESGQHKQSEIIDKIPRDETQRYIQSELLHVTKERERSYDRLRVFFLFLF